MYFPSGLKSLRCLWTNFIHFSRKTASVGNWCIVIPGENNVFWKLWLLGAPATQYLPPLLFGLLVSSAIFCVVFVSLQPRLRDNLSHLVLWPRDLNTIIFTQKPNFCKLIKSSIFNETVKKSKNKYFKQ